MAELQRDPRRGRRAIFLPTSGGGGGHAFGLLSARAGINQLTRARVETVLMSAGLPRINNYYRMDSVYGHCEKYSREICWNFDKRNNVVNLRQVCSLIDLKSLVNLR